MVEREIGIYKAIGGQQREQTIMKMMDWPEITKEATKATWRIFISDLECYKEAQDVTNR